MYKKYFIMFLFAMLITVSISEANKAYVKIDSINDADGKEYKNLWLKEGIYTIDLSGMMNHCIYRIVSENEGIDCKSSTFKQIGDVEDDSQSGEWKGDCVSAKKSTAGSITFNAGHGQECRSAKCYVQICALYKEKIANTYASYKTDFDGPEINSMSVDKEKPQAGEKIKFTIEATDEKSGLDSISLKTGSGAIVGSCEQSPCIIDVEDIQAGEQNFIVEAYDKLGNKAEEAQHKLNVAKLNSPPAFSKLQCISDNGNCQGVKAGETIKLKGTMSDVDGENTRLVCFSDDVEICKSYLSKNEAKECSSTSSWEYNSKKTISCRAEDEKNGKSEERAVTIQTVQTKSGSRIKPISIEKNPADIDKEWSSSPAMAVAECANCAKTFIGQFDTASCPTAFQENELNKNYEEAADMEVLSHKYVCAAGVMDSGGIVFTEPVEFKVSTELNIAVSVIEQEDKGMIKAAIDCAKKTQDGPECDMHTYKIYISYKEIEKCSVIPDKQYSKYKSPQALAKKAWVCAYAKDETGQAVYSYPAEFDIEDKTAPAIKNFGNVKLAGSVKIVFDCSDDESGCDSGTKSYYFSKENPEKCPDSYSYYGNKTNTVNDTTYVCVGQKNMAGLFGYAGTFYIHFDRFAPEIKITGAPSEWVNKEASGFVTCTDKNAMGKPCKSHSWKLFESKISECPQKSASDIYTPSSSFVLDSYQWVCAYAEDSIGTPGYYGPVEFKIDMDEPLIEIKGIPSGEVKSANIFVSCSDEKSGCDTESYRLKEVAENFDCPAIGYAEYNITRIPYKVKANTWLCAVAKDNAGNIGYSSPAQVVLRAIKPKVEVIASPEGVDNQWKTDGSAVSACSGAQGPCESGSEKILIYESHVSSCPKDYSLYKTSSPARIIKHSWVCAAAADNFDVTGFSEPKEFMIDIKQPVVKIKGVTPGWQKSSAEADVSCTDKESGCREATKKLAIYSSPLAECPDADAYETFYLLNSPQIITDESWICAAAQDNAGNIGVTETPAHFKIGDNLLDISVTGAPDAWQSAAQRATITCSSEENEILCKTSSIRVKRMQSETACPISYSSYSESAAGGIYMVSDYTWLCAAAKDSSGKVEGFISYPVQFRVDKTAPSFSITGTDSAYIENCYDLQSGCDENSFALLFKTDSGPCTAEQYKYTLVGGRGSISLEKSGYVCGFARDRAGNVKFAGPVAFSVRK